MRKVFLLSVTLCLFLLSNAQSKSTHSSSYGQPWSKILGWCRYLIQTFFSGKQCWRIHWLFLESRFRLTGLYEIHGNFADAQGLKWYIGPGAHVGFYDYYDHHNNHIDGTFFGIDGVLGLDYKFKGAPINVSIDWQPSFEFGDYVGFDHYGGIGIRYTF
jgi:hypothetical protein